MKNRHWAWMAIAVLLSMSLASMAKAQGLPVGQPQQRVAATQAMQGTRIALLDVNYIFKNHERFKAALAAMKSTVEAADQEVKKDREDIQRLGENLQDYHKGTPEYKAREEELIKKQTELQVKVQSKKNELVQRQAENYNRVYEEILKETGVFCKENAIDMVVQINNEPANVDQPDSILKLINRQVVWSDRSLDITDYILQRLNSNQNAGGVPMNNPNANRNSATGARPTVPFRQ